MKPVISFFYYRIIWFRKVKNHKYGSKSTANQTFIISALLLTFAKSLLIGLLVNLSWRFTTALKKVLKTRPKQLFVIRSLKYFELVPSACLVDDIKLGVIYSFVCQGKGSAEPWKRSITHLLRVFVTTH